MPISGSPTFKLSNKLPYAEHFNLTIQREIGKSAVLSVGSVASRGRHLLSTMESNPGSPAKCLASRPALGSRRTNAVPFGDDTIYDLEGGNSPSGRGRTP